MAKASKARIAPSTISGDPARKTTRTLPPRINHDAAVQETAALTRRIQLLWSHRMTVSPVDLNLVLRTLIDKKIPFVLTGAHGISGWTGQERATKDVDILVKAGRNHIRAVRAMQALYPQLETRDFDGIVAFFVPGTRESVLDVVYPHRADIAETLAHPVWTENETLGLKYRVPALESALANKYGAMISLNRLPDKKYVDIADFIRMVRRSEEADRTPIDRERLEFLGEKVWPGGGGKELLWLLEQVKAGKPVNMDENGKFIKSNRR
jgi:hypothetical protein